MSVYSNNTNFWKPLSTFWELFIFMGIAELHNFCVTQFCQLDLWSLWQIKILFCSCPKLLSSNSIFREGPKHCLSFSCKSLLSSGDTEQVSQQVITRSFVSCCQLSILPLYFCGRNNPSRMDLKACEAMAWQKRLVVSCKSDMQLFLRCLLFSVIWYSLTYCSEIYISTIIGWNQWDNKLASAINSKRLHSINVCQRVS